MNRIEQWMNDFVRLKDVVELVPVRVEESVTILGLDELPAAMAALGAVDGWLVETGSARALHNEVVRLTGIPLGGELCRGDEHWGIDYYQQRWQLAHFKLTRCNAADAVPHLGERVSHLSAGVPVPGALLFWRLWEPDASQPDADHCPPVAHMAVFCGFEG